MLQQKCLYKKRNKQKMISDLILGISLNIYLMQLLFEPFQQRHIDDYVALAIQSYLDNNPQLVSGAMTHDQFISTIKTLAHGCLRIQGILNKENGTNIKFSNVYLTKEGKMVAAGLGCDFHYYITQFKGKLNDVLLREIQQIDLDIMPRMSTVVHKMFAVHKDWQRKGMFQKFTHEKIKYLLGQGYYQSFSIATSPYSLIVLKKNGKIWKDVSNEVNGKKLVRVVVIRDFRKAVKEYENEKKNLPRL